jgi:hypothetical protein
MHGERRTFYIDVRALAEKFAEDSRRAMIWKQWSGVVVFHALGK